MSMIFPGMDPYLENPQFCAVYIAASLSTLPTICSRACTLATSQRLKNGYTWKALGVRSFPMFGLSNPDACSARGPPRLLKWKNR